MPTTTERPEVARWRAECLAAQAVNVALIDQLAALRDAREDAVRALAEKCREVEILFETVKRQEAELERRRKADEERFIAGMRGA